MKVKANVNLLYKSNVYNAGEIFDMDAVSFAVAEKYGRVAKVEGGGDETEIEEMPVANGLPDLITESKKRK